MPFGLLYRIVMHFVFFLCFLFLRFLLLLCFFGVSNLTFLGVFVSFVGSSVGFRVVGFLVHGLVWCCAVRVLIVSALGFLLGVGC